MWVFFGVPVCLNEAALTPPRFHVGGAAEEKYVQQSNWRLYQVVYCPTVFDCRSVLGVQLLLVGPGVRSVCEHMNVSMIQRFKSSGDKLKRCSHLFIIGT